LRQFADDLQDRWEPLKHTLIEWVQQNSDYFYTAEGQQALLQLARDTLDQQAWGVVDEHTQNVFAYGATVARQGESVFGAQPSAESINEILSQPGFVANQAMQFARSYTFNEVVTRDAETMGLFQTRMIQTLEAGEHPSEAAREFANDIDGDYAGWMRIARTETARALNAGLFDESARLGVDVVFIPHSPTTCPDCARLIDGRAFNRVDIEGASNYRRKKADWVPALPMHPNCTHHPIPASKWVQDAAREAAGGDIPPEGVEIDFIPPSQR